MLFIKQNVNLVWELKLNDQIMIVKAGILKTSDFKMQENSIFSFLYLEYGFIYAQQLLNVTNIVGSHWVR